MKQGYRPGILPYLSASLAAGILTASDSILSVQRASYAVVVISSMPKQTIHSLHAHKVSPETDYY
jgi:hypothetical protein